MRVSGQGNGEAEYSGLTEPVSVQDLENHSPGCSYTADLGVYVRYNTKLICNCIIYVFSSVWCLLVLTQRTQSVYGTGGKEKCWQLHPVIQTG